MRDSRDQNIVLKYTISGFFIGLATVLVVLLIDFIYFDLPINQLFDQHLRSPVYIIVDLFPFILAFYSYYLGKRHANTTQELHRAMKKELERSKKIYQFVEKLRNGIVDAKYELQDEDDVLGQAVISLSEELKKNKEEEEKRREEDRQRHWISEGLANFGDILRKDTDNIEELSYNLISYLVKYIEANQGAMFLINDEDENDKHLEMTACYAYERRKYPDKRVEWGEGLLGTVVLEKNSIYLNEIPEEYVHITSGLGESTPKYLFIVPLKVNEEIYGALELASFHEIKPYVRDFVERVAESIASTISNVKINTRTSKLLQESQQQAEELASKEEQMRQNMEELKATQEEAARQSKRFIIFSNAVSHTMIHAEYQPDGKLIYANTKFLSKMGFDSNSEVEGRQISEFIDSKDHAWFDELWKRLANGGKHYEGYMKHKTNQGRDLWTISTYTCMRKDDGSVEKILYLGLDTTEQKQQSLDYEGQIEALNRGAQKLELLPSGDVLEVNENFMNLMEYTESEIKSKTLFDFFQKADLHKFRQTWDKVVNGEIFQGQIKQLTKNGKELWLQVTLTCVNDIYGEVSKVIYVGHDITKQKQMEIETAKQAKLLKEKEEKLKKSQVNLERELDKAREEVKKKFKEMEKEKIRNDRTLEGASDAIFTIDNEGIVKFFNKAAEDLWQIEKPMILGRNINKLFPKKIEEYDDFTARLIDPDKEKIVGERKEITITNTNGEEIPVIIILSAAKVEDETTYTAFIQNIAVDLF